MIGMEGKTLTSERLAYRLIRPEDKPALAAMLADPDVTKPAGYLPAASEEEFDEFFDILLQKGNGVAVLLRDDSASPADGGELIGYLRANKYIPDEEHLKDKACVGLGFVIGKPYQCRGYGTEMLRTMTDYLLERFYMCYADCFVENEVSRRTIEKCGYRYAGDYAFWFEEFGEKKQLHSFVRTAKSGTGA